MCCDTTRLAGAALRPPAAPHPSREPCAAPVHPTLANRPQRSAANMSDPDDIAQPRAEETGAGTSPAIIHLPDQSQPEPASPPPRQGPRRSFCFSRLSKASFALSSSWKRSNRRCPPFCPRRPYSRISDTSPNKLRQSARLTAHRDRPIPAQAAGSSIHAATTMTTPGATST